MSEVIEIKNFTKNFGKLIAVDNISLNVKKGEIFGFLGPNGAGKSTTIRCLMGFNKPTKGNIKIFGSEVHLTTPKILKKIGYLPGNIQLYDNWTGSEHIRFFEGIRGRSRIAGDLVSRLDFDKSIKFRYLSSGNKQKLGLILALMNEPDVLILDEPTLGLDPLLQNEIHKILLELNSKGVTIFISSHNLSEVEKICNKVGIIKSGKLIVVEEIANLKSRKIHHISAHFKNSISPKYFSIPGVEIVSILGNTFEFKVSGDLNNIIRNISAHSLIDLEITHASLEDIFMKYYERTE